MKRLAAAIAPMAILTGLAVFWCIQSNIRMKPEAAERAATVEMPGRVEADDKPKIDLPAPDGCQAVKIRVPPVYMVASIVRRWAESRVDVYEWKRSVDGTSSPKLLLKKVYVLAEEFKSSSDQSRASIELTLAVNPLDVPKLEDAKRSSELFVAFARFKDATAEASPKNDATPIRPGELVHALTIVNGDRIESVEYRKDSNTGKLSVVGAAQMETR